MVAGISVDPPPVNAAMVDKLRLPFPLLADPGGERAIRPWDLWNERGEVALPATLLFAPGDELALHEVSRDFADRTDEDALVEAAEGLGLAAIEPGPPAPGDPQPSDRAFPADGLKPYFSGARFSAIAMAHRVEEARPERDRLVAEADGGGSAPRLAG